MAITAVSSPATVKAFQKDALVWQYQDAYTVTGVGNSVGLCQLTITGAGAAFDVGEYVRWSSLVDVDNVETPVVRITAKATNSITVDTPYVAYANGSVRAMKPLDFVIKSGNTSTPAQPKRTSQTLKVKADPDGIYRASGYGVAISRMKWAAPAYTTGSDYDNTALVVAYPTAISEPSSAAAYKLNEAADIATRHTNLPYIYDNCRVPFMRIESALFKTLQEQAQTTQLIEGASAVDLLFISGKSYTITFNALVGNFAFSPSLPAGITLVGQQLQVNLPANSAADNVTYAVEDTTTGDGWAFKVRVIDSQNIRQGVLIASICDDDFVICFYHPSRGWLVYPFKQQEVYTITGNEARIVQDSQERRAIAYDDIYEAVNLSTLVSSEAVLDDLNTLNYCTQIYKVGITGTGATRSVDLSNVERYYVEGGEAQAKAKRPFIATSNQFNITLIKSEPIYAANQ